MKTKVSLRYFVTDCRSDILHSVILSLFLICFHCQVNSHQVQHLVRFLVGFLNIFHSLWPFGGCRDVIGINLKTLMASTTRTLIPVGGLFVGFSGDIHYNFLQKFDLQLERVFSFSLPTEYGLLVTGQFIIIQR